MAATYPIAVPSLADMFPELPQIPVVTNCRIDESKAAGDPIDEDAAHSAEQTVHVLQALRRTVPELTDAHIEGAKNRAHVLRAIREWILSPCFSGNTLFINPNLRCK